MQNRVSAQILLPEVFLIESQLKFRPRGNVSYYLLRAKSCGTCFYKSWSLVQCSWLDMLQVNRGALHEGLLLGWSYCCTLIPALKA